LIFATGTACADSQRASIWTGFYANAGVGYGLWDAETTTDAPGRCVSCATTNHSGKGWLGEVGLGYDYQFSDRIVAGLLFNYDFSDMRGKSSDAVFTTADTSNDTAWFVGVRAGWLMTPEILNYWSVGYTQTHFSGGSLHNSFTGAQLPGARLDSYDAGGWFVGGGLEVAMRERWFWRSEARYADYSNDVRLETGISPVFQLNFDPVVGTATSEIVYKFDWGR
jgi:outer membrane immunogenic protein